ncbi:competence type IV pilus minor pilin ComGF [Niallia sp. XMNu-256]|uniref:competence type IV pilus minor pilin ComGF n=1 Tax=Niallia sp. XMNu-256 TaxID=3082444 RepID=UPI0030CF4AFF
MKTYLAKLYNLQKLFNNQGFTFVEMLMAFSIFLIIASFIPLGINMIYKNEIIDKSLQKMEWQVFISQTKKEIRMSEHVYVNNNQLILLKGGQEISYERYGTNIRRRVGSMGHEIMLQNINSVKFEETVRGVQISVRDNYQQNNSTIIRTLISEGV